MVYVVVIFWLGAAHVSVPLPQSFLSPDKIAHFVAFGLLAVLLLRALRYEFPSITNGRAVIASVALSSLLGALLEAWQALFPHRSLELADWIADTLGAMLAGSVAALWLRRRRSRGGAMQAVDSPG